MMRWKASRSTSGRVAVTRETYETSVAGLARQDHAGSLALADDARDDRLELAVVSRCEHLLGARVGQQGLQVLDRREDQRQPVVPVALERLRRRDPGRPGGLGTVRARRRVGWREGDVEAGVEANRRGLGGDPARPWPQVGVGGKLDSGLLAELPRRTGA